MRAVVFTATGSTDVLQVVDREPGEPGPGEVRVRIARSGVNPTDWKIRSGATGDPLAGGEAVPNQDGAGVVDAVGDVVTDVAVGDRVWLMMAAHERGTGTAQELTVVPVERVVGLPDGASFDLGASLGVPAVTAWRCLTTSEDGPDRLAPGTMAGLVVLVQGGAGAVGNAAIQLARWAGATVITTVSSDAKGALATAAGADHVVDYTTGDVESGVRALAPDGVDVVVEVAPATNLTTDLALIKQRGTIAVYANNGGAEVTLDVRTTFSTNARISWVYLYEVGTPLLRAAAEDVNAAIEDDSLGVGEDHGLPLTHLPLEETASAHGLVEDGAVGKVLVDVADL